MFNLVNVLAFNANSNYCIAGASVPGNIISLISTAYTLIKVFVPILLILFGALDIGKAVMAQKEDDIKKGWQTFLKRLIQAAILFFIFTIVQIVISVIASGDSATVTGAMDCVLNKSCDGLELASGATCN